MTLGQRIKELREISKMTQSELGEKLFVSDKTISKWEGDKSEPEINILVKLSKLFNVTLDYLTTGNSSLEKTDAISKIELACREDNIALLNNIDLNAFDSSGKDINYYAEKYDSKNILKYLKDMEFVKTLEEGDYKKIKPIYYICAIPSGLVGEENLKLLRKVNIKENITKDCVILEGRGYHHFKVFRKKTHWEKCSLDYQWLDINVLNENGSHVISMHFSILDDDQSACLGISFYGDDKPLSSDFYVRPSVVKEFVDELNLIQLKDWEIKYWGCPIFEIFYSLKKEKDDKSLMMYHKKYIAPNKNLYLRFVKAIQNLALESFSPNCYKYFVSKFNTDYTPYYRETLDLAKSKLIFESIEKEMITDNLDIKNIF